MVPTAQQLKTEIETGPLAVQLAPYWSNVFADDFTEPAYVTEQRVGESDEAYASRVAQEQAAFSANWAKRTARLQDRQGTLTPDAEYDILRLLNDTSLFTVANGRVSRGAFIAAVASMSGAIAALANQTKRDHWTLVLNLLTGGDDDVNLLRPEIGGLFDLAIADGLLGADPVVAAGTKAAILSMGGTTTQSRLQALNWTVTADLLQAARAIADG